MKIRNEILNRNWLDWLCLIFAVVNFIIGIQKLSYYSYFNLFVSGLLFGVWVFAGIMNRNFKQIRTLINMGRKLLDEKLENYKIKELKKQKGGKKR